MDRTDISRMRHPSELKNMVGGQNHERKESSACRFWLALAIVVVAMSSWIAPVSAIDIAYCSDLNTGSDGESMVDNFQSNGLCYNNCNDGGYAFAIVQGKNCWCSNYVPGSETDVGDCNQSCPGYPDDKCGNASKDLYGYLSLPSKPSGTKGGETTTPTKASTKKTTTKLTASTASSTSSKDDTTVVSTINGVTTIIIAPTVAPTVATSTPPSVSASASSAASSDGGSFFSSPGRTAGLVVGLILALALIVAGVLFYKQRQRRRHALLYGSDSPGSAIISAGGAGTMVGRQRSRSISTLGLVGEKGQQSPTQVTVAPPAPAQAAGGTVYDQRLDPDSLFMRFDHQTGSSRMSVRSLRDDHDYSRRVLRLANPDD